METKKASETGVHFCFRGWLTVWSSKFNGAPSHTAVLVLLVGLQPAFTVARLLDKHSEAKVAGTTAKFLLNLPASILACKKL